MALRSARRHAGAAALSEMLAFPVPAAEQRSIPCSCSHQAGYRELRSKAVLSAVGEIRVSRPYYLMLAGPWRAWPGSWTCRSLGENRFPFCIRKWTGPECPS